MKHLTNITLGLAVVFALAACSSTSAPPEVGQDAVGLETQGGTISYDDGVKRIYSFVVTRGRLKVNYWNGSSWNWADQGLPQSATGMTDFDLQGLPSVITYKDSANRQRIYVFVRGRDKHLYVNYWDGFRWRWAHQGTPGGTTNLAYNSPEAITYKDESGRQRIYVFVKGSDNRLHVNYWDGFAWRWANQGLPAGAVGIYPTLRATTYRDAQSGRQRIYVFATANQKLYVHYWDGFAWRWADQGRPVGTNVADVVAATSYRYVLRDRIYALVRGSNNRIYANVWDGSSWQWQDAGTPPGTTVTSWAKSDMVDYRSQAGGWARLEIPFRGNNGRLYLLHYDDARSQNAKWYWEDQSTPPGTTVYTLHGVTAYVDPAQRAYAFAMGSNGGFYVNYTTNTAVTGQRNWAFQGTP